MLSSPLFLLSSLCCRSLRVMTLTVILLLLLFCFSSEMKKLEGPLLLPKRRKASFYRCMRCVALSLEASGQGKGSAAERRVCICQFECVFLHAHDSPHNSRSTRRCVRVCACVRVCVCARVHTVWLGPPTRSTITSAAHVTTLQVK